jgi:hypothetical protein
MLCEFVIRPGRVGGWGLHEFSHRTFWHLKTFGELDGQRIERRGQSFALHSLPAAFEAFQRFMELCRNGEGR